MTNTLERQENSNVLSRRPRRRQHTKDVSHSREYNFRDNITPSPNNNRYSLENITNTSIAMHHTSHTFSFHQRSSTDVPFADELVKAKVSLRAEIEGEKKYSPPFGTTHFLGSVRSVLWLLGFAPDILKSVGLSIWPIMGSTPGSTGFFGGNLGLFAQPQAVSADTQQKTGQRAPTILDESEAIANVALVAHEKQAALVVSRARGGFKC